MKGRKKLTKAEREARSAAAAILGSAGGKKGGHARARALSAKERSAVAAQGGAAFAKLSRRARSAAARRGWETRRAQVGAA